ncbi:M50 family metallopeptidase [Kutzneria kofuensis]|uniref:Membrane-associated protease RseP (Regulator of RpoE activity) n=1 Tax=Kutzneria kofuensis TaxID=103725 RepID=A0A7W9KKC7_9PSEU|nr:site-2 protease family protein [Kutzneria kofuensis]MBB5894150.1 membrane-associated protease RseP (regulator of RpoE activity) [Kutzneria kofuensis]
MVNVLGVVLFALGIGISVALHEFGHLLTAKAFGMKVTRYFIGFGPKIWSFRRGETEYGLKVIPAGGFCEIVGMTALDEVAPEDAPRAFYRQKTWKRVIVLSAGSITHFILGLLIIYVAAISLGLPNTQNLPIAGEISQCAQATQDPVTGKYSPCTASDPAPAKAAGLQPGDRILSVAGKPTPTYNDMVTITRDAKGPTPFVVERDGRQLTLSVDVATVQRILDPTKPLGPNDKTGPVGAIGMSPSATISYGPIAAFGATGVFTGQMFGAVWDGLKALPTKIPALLTAIAGGQRDADAPVSVVGASLIGGQAADRGLWWFFVILLANLNFFVGVFNLLPLLPLDGGHIAVNLYERVRDAVRKWRGKPAGAPVDYVKLLPLTYLLVLLGGAYTLLAITADIVNPIKLG